jgi:DUF1680 family protein
VGNISRTLLMMPTWTYVKSKDALYVNLFAGSRINVGKIAGTDVEVVQKTNYPWEGSVDITVNPQQARKFSVYVRIPNRNTSKLYRPTPAVGGYKSFAVNGKAVKPAVERGYAVITREWKAGDRIRVEFPLEAQRLKADERIQANVGDVALRYGALIYNTEEVDQADLTKALAPAPLKAEWRPDLLGGVVAISGKWQDGSPMLAIPNFARMNRLDTEPLEAPSDLAVNYAPGATAGSNQPQAAANRTRRPFRLQSQVWIKDQA